MGRKHQDTPESRERIRVLAAEIRAAQTVFNTLRNWRELSECWATHAAVVRGEDSAAVRLRSMSELAQVTASYIVASANVRAIAPSSVHREIDEASRHAQAFVLDGERPGYPPPVTWALVVLSNLRAVDRGVVERCLDDIAWSAAWSDATFVQAIDSGRALAFEGMPMADIAHARKLALENGRRTADRDADRDAVSVSRARLQADERAWLRKQPQHVIDANERAFEADLVGAITLRPRRG